jgi:hypothetical protein
MRSLLCFEGSIASFWMHKLFRIFLTWDKKAMQRIINFDRHITFE